MRLPEEDMASGGGHPSSLTEKSPTQSSKCSSRPGRQAPPPAAPLSPPWLISNKRASTKARTCPTVTGQSDPRSVTTATVEPSKSSARSGVSVASARSFSVDMAEGWRRRTGFGRSCSFRGRGRRTEGVAVPDLSAAAASRKKSPNDVRSPWWIFPRTCRTDEHNRPPAMGILIFGPVKHLEASAYLGRWFQVHYCGD